MTDSDSNPKPPLWIFILADVAFMVAAWFIAQESKKPLSLEAALLIVGCIAAGAIIVFYPIVSRFEQAKNETLDQRQRALENLASTINASAEQISIAANGLHEVVDLAQKNLKHAEQLPHKLQDKIAEFQSLLANADAGEKEELEKELVSLRASESERLEAIATKIAKSTAEFAKLEAATQQHLTAANEAVAKLSLGTAAAIGKAQAAAEQALAAARTEAAKGVGEAAGHAAKSIDSAKTAALVDFEAKLAAAGDALVARLGRDAGAKSSPAPAAAAPAEPAAVSDAEKSDTPAQPPKKPRKRRDEAAPDEPPAPAAPVAEDVSPKIQSVEEPAPIPVQKIPEVAPVAPHTAEPFAGALEATAVPSSPALAAADAPKPARKRIPKKPAEEPAAAAAPAKEDLGLDIDQTPKPAAEMAERVLSSDGATRLLVTAYIGIGNRIFIRGEGPGLSWEKGIPLQFVSIGKWRWETNDASAGVSFKLYKNDDVECTALGAQKLDPGYQQEVTAAF